MKERPAAVLTPPVSTSISPLVKPSELKSEPIPFTPPPRKILDRSVLQEVTLPPEAPSMADVKSVRADAPVPPARTLKDRDLEKLLSNLTVPTPVSSPVFKEVPTPVRSSPSRPSVLDEMQKLHEEMQKQMRNVEPPPRQTASQPSPPTPAPVMKASLRNPATAIQAQGMGSGSNPYLLLVQRQISGAWVPPQVDPTVQSFQVIIKFRLFRNGSVKDVIVEQTSGNEYYDMAGKRAILAATPLPAFPEEMSEAYLDTHFSFMVGQQSG
jgi:colicin import membrane protein